METVGLFEAKQKLSELVERASGGEEIGITRHGELMAKIVPSDGRKLTWKALFDHPEKYQIALKPGVQLDDRTIRDLISEGRK